MTSLRNVFPLLIIIAIRRLRIQSSIYVTGLLLAVIISAVYLVQPTKMMHYQQQQNNTNTSVNAVKELTSINSRTLSWANEGRVNDCQYEKKSLVSLLATEKEIHQKTNKTLIDKIKLMEQEIKQEKNQTDYSIRKLMEENKVLQVNIAVHRKFFSYAATYLRDTPYPGVENYTRYTVARLGMSPLPGIEPLKAEYGPVINDVTSFRYPMTIPACQTNISFNQSVFIAVISAPGNFDKRNTIRQTWRKHLKSEYHKGLMSIAGFAFILGLTDHNETQIKIKEERKTHGDIIQIDMADFYRNLSLKVAGLFNWLYRNCLKIDFLFKVDDDVYVNVRNLAQFVQSFHKSNQSMFGLAAVSSLKPIRDGKWGVNFEEWPWNTYPGYYLGPAVLFSGRTIFPLLAAFQTTPMMTIDDIYVTGMCVEKAKLNRTSFSSNYTTVYAMSQPVVPLACDLRRLISWLTVSAIHMNNSHVATDDFYLNRTQCIATGSNGTNTTINHNDLAKFFFV